MVKFTGPPYIRASLVTVGAFARSGVAIFLRLKVGVLVYTVSRLSKCQG